MTEEVQINQNSGHIVQLENFEGPLDLLLYLIQRNEMDIFSVSLSKVAQDYLQIISQAPEVDLDEGGSFLVLAATLILFKARQLLPAPPEDFEEEIFDPDAERRRREEFERFKKVAELLKAYEKKWINVYSRQAGTEKEKTSVVWEFEDVSIYDLYQAFQKVISELGAEKPAVVFGEDYTVDEKMAELRILLSEIEMFCLSQYLIQMRSRSEIIVTFLALLELVRLQELAVKQSKIHAEIWIVKTEQLDTQEESEE